MCSSDLKALLALFSLDLMALIVLASLASSEPITFNSFTSGSDYVQSLYWNCKLCGSPSCLQHACSSSPLCPLKSVFHHRDPPASIQEVAMCVTGSPSPALPGPPFCCFLFLFAVVALVFVLFYVVVVKAANGPVNQNLHQKLEERTRC